MNNPKKIEAFVERWTGKGDEKGQSQIFWIELLQDVLGVDTPSEVISFENRVKLAHTSFIDAYLPKTHVMIEQKSITKDLREGIRQSDGSVLNPFQQAKRYSMELPYSLRPRWVVTCNFKSFLIYDMEQPQGEPFELLLENLAKEAHCLRFLVEEKDSKLKHEMEVSIKAGDLVGKIYDAFLRQYNGEETEADLHALNVLCVRLVFCLYAEDAGVFQKDQFYYYLKDFQPSQMRTALRDLFQVLDTPIAQRDRFLEKKLADFPYVNGSLFRQQPGETIPPVTEDTAHILLDKASLGFNWSDISPTIFGAVFESTLNPETRRSGGMHYTSIENIHRVIDPLFMDDLNAEFEQLRALPQGKHKLQQLSQFQDKLASLKFLDPACGSGNFLTETYISLRRLENKAILEQNKGQGVLAFDEVNPIRVSIHQFYGIEINDFAATVAKSALWIAEAQMMNETEAIVQFTNDYLPLKSYDNIREGNALRIDWADVVKPEELSYIIGNPPFVGARWMDKQQKEDVFEIFGKKWQGVGDLDYVCCWYKKAADIMQDTQLKSAFVSTNSITQGASVANLWKPLMEEFNIKIDFAWRTFIWDSESSLKAHVHCVIVGFSLITTDSNKKRKIFKENNVIECDNINGYLTAADNAFIEKRMKPLADVPQICLGGQAIDDGNLVLTIQEKEELLKQDPTLSPFIRPYMMGKDFIDRKPRYCFWLKGVSPGVIRSNKILIDRVEKVKQFRLKSDRSSTLKAADTPMLFAAPFESEGDYVAIPKVSSERRRYVPMEYLSKEIIPGDKLFVMQNATFYHFGILTSNVHMAWMRAVCGRMKSDYSYSNTIVYNNFPWPAPTDEQKARIEQTAQAILDARALYPDSSLADLYDEVTMPPELRRAHQQNDRAVMQAYGFPIKDFTESDCVAELLKMYKELTK